MGRWSKLTRKGRWKAIMQLIKLMEVHMQLTHSPISAMGSWLPFPHPKPSTPAPSGRPASSPPLQLLSSQQGNQVMLVGEGVPSSVALCTHWRPWYRHKKGQGHFVPSYIPLHPSSENTKWNGRCLAWLTGASWNELLHSCTYAQIVIFRV